MKILFICEYNACRSQMAEGIARHVLPKDVVIDSAGIYPGAIHEWTVEVMQEIGIDISTHSSKQLSAVSEENYDYMIVLAEPTAGPTQIINAKHRLYWFYPDPAAAPGGAEEVKSRIREMRDILNQRIREFSKDL